MFRRDPRDNLERQLSQFRQQLEQETADEELTTEEELPRPPSSESPSTVSGPSTWQASEAVIRTQPAPVTDRATTVVAANAHWEGTIESEGSVWIHGRLHGTVRAAHDVTVAPGAEVQAEIYAQNIVIHGLVQGRIEARSRLEIFPEGQVTGEICAPSLIVHEGAHLSGKLKMEASAASEEVAGGGA